MDSPMDWRNGGTRSWPASDFSSAMCSQTREVKHSKLQPAIPSRLCSGNLLLKVHPSRCHIGHRVCSYGNIFSASGVLQRSICHTAQTVASEGPKNGCPFKLCVAGWHALRRLCPLSVHPHLSDRPRRDCQTRTNTIDSQLDFVIAILYQSHKRAIG